MKYTIYHLYKKTHNITSPTQLTITHTSCLLPRAWNTDFYQSL